jgi:hypothetical protein
VCACVREKFSEYLPVASEEDHMSRMWIAMFVVACACSLNPGQARAQSTPAVAGQLPVKFLNKHQAARKNIPLTLNDFNKLYPGTTASTLIPLKNGKKIAAGELLTMLNRLEKMNNKAGFSLRDKVKVPIRLMSPIRLKPRTSGIPETIQPSNVPFTQFPKGSWTATSGDASKVAVELTSQTSLANSASTLEGAQALTLGGYVFGNYIELARSTQSGSIPPQLDGCGLFAETNVAGAPSDPPKSGSCSAGAATTISSSARNNVSEAVEYTQSIWGPLEVTVRIEFSATGDVGSAVTGSAHRLAGDVSIGTDVWLSLRVTGGVYLIAAGQQADLRLAKYSVNQTSVTTATEQPDQAHWKTTEVGWSSGFRREFESGDGAITFVLVFDSILFGEATFEWTIYTWDGAPPKVTEVKWGPFKGVRPAVCTSTTVSNGAMCSGSCVSLVNDLNNCGTCGTVCPMGANRSCDQGFCHICIPRCSGRAPGEGDGCSGVCPDCAKRQPSGTLVWCEPMRSCTTATVECADRHKFKREFVDK